MKKAGSGLTDKLYWRPGHGRVWHCFKRQEGGGYRSLCGREERWKSLGQRCMRPDPLLRCGQCDGDEMARRGWD